ncbi:hypothetical protein [Pedobacter sp. Leaf170]|uniref:hypothetical protein n=1 Tax=Pedobacter sp. Leaf170 TaxID=2876558 RepID=UPI001E3F20F3|nr:hypothetical protein [Pedobacter sp. Leaf170]
MNKKNYFLKLYNYSFNLLNSLPIALEPLPINYALNILKPAIDKIQEDEILKIHNFRTEKKIGTPGNSNNWQGLNSIGMLMDRFTILIIREWSLKNKVHKNHKKAKEIYKKQTLDIIEAMTHTSPGTSSMNTKITNIKQSLDYSTWEESFFGMITINLILWEAQEVLYIKDIAQLPSEELRSYIDWFSKGNIKRNECIQLCEEYFWTI